MSDDDAAERVDPDSEPEPSEPEPSEPAAVDAADTLAVEPPTGIATEARLFIGLGLFAELLAVIYAGATGRSERGVEYAGVAVLALGGVFSIFLGLFLMVTLRHIQADVAEMEEAAAAGGHDDVLYLPTESVWPIGIGVGVCLAGAGIPLGLWVMIPGAALFVYSVIGFARQSRNRT